MSSNENAKDLETAFATELFLQLPESAQREIIDLIESLLSGE